MTVRPGRRTDRRDAESGVSAVEFVLLTPLLFFLIFVTVQFALFFFARHVAIAAAQEGARVARAEAADPRYSTNQWSDDASSTADKWIGRLAPNLLQGSAVATDRAPDRTTVSVTVTAAVPSIVPWTTFTVSETSTGPVEQFIGDN